MSRKKKSPVSKPPAKPYTPASVDAAMILYLQSQSALRNQDGLHPKPVGLPRPKAEPLSLARAIAGGTSVNGKPKPPVRLGTKWPNAA